METRFIGRTGISTPVIAFGGIPCNRVAEEQAVTTVRRSVELGYRLFDTSRTYGDSERRIGAGLDGRQSQVVLATKLAPWKIDSQEDAAASIAASLEALAAPRIDILMIKNFDDDERTRRGLTFGLPAVKRAREAGQVGHIGMTSHIPRLAETVLRTGEFSVALLPYSIANRSHEPVLDLCREMGIGVLAMKPLAGGALVEGGGRELPSIREAVRFCLGHPAVAAAVVGLATPHQAEVAWQAGLQATPLAADERAALIAAAESLGEDYCRGCAYCQPCASEIEIGVILQMADRVRRFPKDTALRDASRARYRSLQVAAEACSECGECLPRCPFGLTIPERLQAAHDLLARWK